jgi:hypothetical protein
MSIVIFIFMHTTSLNMYAGTVLGSITSPDNSHLPDSGSVGTETCWRMYDTKLQVSGLPYKCIFVVNKHLIKIRGICNILILLKDYLYKYRISAFTW